MTAGANRRGFAARPADPDQWIKASDASTERRAGAEFTARLTIDVTPDQRGRIKVAAFKSGVTVAEMLRDLLAREFPPTSGDQP